MPRAVKTKAPGAAAVPAKKAAGKKSKLYAMPEKLKEGTVLTDLIKGQWRIGASIGIGGFGEIYAACRVGEKNYDAVVKCEPHGNGPLFVEMHFYLRNAKLDDIKEFKQKHGLKSLGMPYILANGSADINGIKHRFIVMPRYGSDISKFYVENGKRLPEGTVYRLAIQMLDVYEFMHSTGYVHADLKAANILLGTGKGGGAQAYLVDFGLASHYVTGEFKPDPKKMHNGTIEYTSRDAHMGVATRRADLEILGYNLIEWLGVELPWVKEKLLAVPTKVQKAKESFMLDVSSVLKSLFPKGVPAAIADYLKYVSKLAHNEAPDYGKCRNIFLNALKQMKISNAGDLEFKLKPTSSNNNSSPEKSKGAAASKGGRSKAAALTADSSVEEVIEASDEDDDGDNMFEPEPRKKPAKPSPAIRAKQKKISPTRRPAIKVERMKPSPTSPRKRQAVHIASPSPRKRLPAVSPGVSSPSPRKRASVASPSQRSPTQKRSRTNGPSTPKPTSSALSDKRQTPGTANGLNAKINFSPSVSVRGRPGKTVVNDDLTPNPRSNKTYEFNFELDVSMDANVIVNVKRKKKVPPTTTAKSQGSSGSIGGGSGDARTPKHAAASNEGDTPVTRVNLRKVDGETGTSASSSSGRSPRTPAVTVRKYKH
ncbi:nucleosomal histone kinase 1 [Scaptodrosophila lebanonensis]|uniref:non-specific serine/threonine protein kinase n=1 Tax=Drosophila lebanonensis TaxID=7225 RepID=A0A6J2T2X0_DROLE|nr:nucleosomal histone kinase 1 [Scaptodrosophila lebanonensis]